MHLSLCFVVLTSFFSACSSQPTAKPFVSFPTIKKPKLFISFNCPQGIIAFELEIARTSFEKEKGLMFRKTLAANTGMLFIFDEEDIEHSFWMKNTTISLDIIFLDKNKKVIGVIEKTEPQSLAPLSIQAPSRYVLEINAGLAKKFGIQKGTQAMFELFSYSQS